MVLPRDARLLSLADLPGRLREAMGPHDDWWDVDTPFEVLAGSVLVQNTNWRGVEKSLARLRWARVTSPDALLAVPERELAELIRPTGFPLAKERALRGLCAWWLREVRPFSSGDLGFVARSTGDEGVPAVPTRLFADAPLLAHRSTDELRGELLALRGIGPETADVVLLHLLGRERFVADTYARRLFTRMGVAVPRGYEAFASQVQPRLTLTVAQWREFHALIDDYAKAYCRSDAAWETGPLEGWRLV